MYRSGTTLLYALLNQHSKIALMYECDALAVLMAEPNARRWPRWLERNELWNHFLTRHGISRKELEEVRDLRGLYLSFAQRTGASFYGEKSPAYNRWLPKVVTNFRGARIIVVLRELPEIYQSMRDAGRTGSRFFRRKGQLPRLIWAHRTMMRDIRRLEAGAIPVLCLRYREVVTDAAAIARRICDFLGIEFEEAMGSLIGADFSAIYDDPHHSQVRSKRIIRRSEGRAKISGQLHHQLRMFGQASGQEAFIPLEKLPPLSAKLRVRYVVLLALGRVLCCLDDGKRLLYEYLPTAWFHGYRSIRNRRHQRKKRATESYSPTR